MQRDFDLVVTLLGALRDTPAAKLSTEELVDAVQVPEVAEVDAETVQHHLAILDDAGLVKRLDEVESTSWRLTWNGYDALDNDEEEEGDDDA